jgi:hypothetical protein
MKKLISTNKRHWNSIHIVLIFLLTFLVLNSCNDTEKEFTDDVLNLKSSVLPEIAGDLFLSNVTFVRAEGDPVKEIRTLNENDSEQYAPDFILYLQNGDEAGKRVSSAVVKLNGKLLFGPLDFSQQVDQLSVPVSGITSESVLEVEVRGEPGGFIQIWIEGTLLEEENPYKMYFITNYNRSLYGVRNDDTHAVMYQFEGSIQQIKAYDQKLFVHEINYSTDTRAIHVLDYDGNKIETLDFPAEVIRSVGFTILPDGRFAIYNNTNNVIYFLNPDFTFITQVSFTGSYSMQNMIGVVVGNDLIISQNGYKSLLKVDLTNYDISIFRDFSNLPDNWIGAITYVNGTFYLCGPQNIYSFKAGETENLIVTLPINNNVDIEIDGNYAYVGSYFGGKIYKINLTDGSYTDYIYMSQVADLELVK